MQEPLQRRATRTETPPPVFVTDEGIERPTDPILGYHCLPGRGTGRFTDPSSVAFVITAPSPAALHPGEVGGPQESNEASPHCFLRGPQITYIQGDRAPTPCCAAPPPAQPLRISVLASGGRIRSSRDREVHEDGVLTVSLWERIPLPSISSTGILKVGTQKLQRHQRRLDSAIIRLNLCARLSAWMDDVPVVDQGVQPLSVSSPRSGGLLPRACFTRSLSPGPRSDLSG